MLELVTAEEARHQLRLDEPGSDGGPDDGWLAIWIPVVSEAVASWLKDEWRLYVSARDSEGAIVLDSGGVPVPETDSGGTPVVHPLVRGAALIELASLYRFREGEGDNRVEAHEGYGYVLSKTATALLSGRRKSTVA